MRGHCEISGSKPIDDIEKYRDPEKLFREIEQRVSSLKDHLSNFPSFHSSDEAAKCYHLLDTFLKETSALIPLITQLDFSDVPANGLRSCLRLWMKYLDIAMEMQNEAKVQRFVTVLAHHLCLWPALIEKSVECMTQGRCDASSREQVNYFYSTYDHKNHATLLNRKLMARTFDTSMFPFLLLFLRIGVWSTEPSLKRRIFNEHYLTYKNTVRSLLKRLDTVRPESTAAWVRSANWLLTQTFVRSVSSIMHPLRYRGHRLTKKKFLILCPSHYCIKLNDAGISFDATDENRNINNNNGDGLKASQSVSSSLVKFFTLHSTDSRGRRDRKTAAKSRGEPKDAGDSGQREKLVKSEGGRCAFFSQKSVQSDPSQKTSNNGKILIYIHGGAFFGPQSSSVINIFLRDWSQRLPGVTVIVPEYSYSPEASFPVAWQEMLDLYIWLVTSRDASDKLQMTIDPAKIVLAGDSSGGLLVSSLLVMLNEINRQFKQNIPVPREVVLLFPKCSLRLEVTPSILLSNYDLVINGFMLARVAQAVLPISKIDKHTKQKNLISPEERKNLHPEWFKSSEYQVADSPILSPLSYDRWHDLAHVNLNIVVVTFDPLLDDGVQFAKNWRGKINLHVADNVCHGAFYYRQFAPCGDSFNDEVLRIISSAIDSL